MHTAQHGAYSDELARAQATIDRLTAELRQTKAERERARDLAVELENELAEVNEAHDHTLAALYQAGCELCECREGYPRHVRGVPGCRYPHDVHEGRAA